MNNDFSKGKISALILKLAIPMTVAQLINVLYNIVDRFFIGRGVGTLALTGLGLTFPILTMVAAFSNLISMGGAPLFSIERGRGNIKQAEKIMGNSFSMLCIFGISLTIIGLIIKEPVLYLFGADQSTFDYANNYIRIYLLGTIFVMLSLGMNSFINAQGFSVIGMLSIAIGALINIILDPIFIYIFHMGVEGAALATIMSQCISCIWILSFLLGKKTLIKLKKSALPIELSIIKKIVSLGAAGFVMQVTNSSVQIVCNKMLSIYGGTLYIGVMTVLNSIREIVQLPANGLTSGGQPVLSFNYGARKYDRVLQGIKFMTIVCLVYTVCAWGIVNIFDEFFIHIFNNDTDLVSKATPALSAYFFGFFMMSFQFAGQTTFTALGKSKHAVFFSIFRKVIIVVPLTIILPKFFGVMGVFYAEPISNFIGGGTCYSVMLLTVGRELKKDISQA